MKACIALVALMACAATAQEGDLADVSGLTCPAAGYMFPDSNNLCFVWFCERGGEAPIKRACPKGVRVPSWWEGGTLNMCNIVNILKHGGEPTCLRCAADDVKPDDSCAGTEYPCPDECTCIDTEHTHRCDCPETDGVFGHGGAVDFPANHCEPDMCENGATCQNQWDGFFCFCPNGWTGHRCETSVCDWHPCLNGGTCVIDDIGYHCECTDCWGGSCCNVTLPGCAGPVDEIATQPKPECNACQELRDGYCAPIDNSAICSNGGSCAVDDSGNPTCQDCDECYTGPLCKVLVDSCKCNNNCPANSVCEDISDKNSHECICDDCYGGAKCEVALQTCACANPCDADAICRDGDNGPVCECGDCMTGPLCDQPVTSCACSNPCTEGQQCSEAADGTLSCGCADPCYTGADCTELINNCGCNDPCNGGMCEDSENGPVCADCPECFTGQFCDQAVVSCKCNSPCPNGVCNMVDDEPVCGCEACYTGDDCSTEVNSCECNNPCENPDTCQDTQSGAVCVCDCTGNEVCNEESQTCTCPECYYNAPGEAGCLSRTDHLCICNNPCTADQQVCVDGQEGGDPECKIGNPSSGNAFTIVFEENHTEKSLKQIPLEIYCTPSVPDSGSRTVNIRSAGLSPDNYCYFNDTVTIPENDVLRYEVDRCMRHNKTGLDHVSIRLTEVNNDAMIVYGINKDRWSADGFLATPDVQAGKVFQTVSYSPAHRGTQFAIAALFDDTVIEMTLADDNDLPAPYNVKGAKYTLTMNAFETFQVQAICPVKRGSKKSYCSKDLSGTVIKSDKNIHVFSGNIRAFVKAGEGFSRDHLVEELVPTDRWGSYFGLVSVPGRAVGDLLNIMALVGETTTVSIFYYSDDGTMESEEFTLPINGKVNVHKDVPSGKRIVVQANKPCSVTQLTKSKDTYLYSNETVHDPVSITVPPVDQFTNNFFFSTPLFTGGETFNLQPYQATLAMVVAVSGQEQYITMGNEPITDFLMPWGPMPSMDGQPDLVGAVFVIPHGTKLIRNTEGHNFQCLIYGYDDRESYGLPAAMNFKVMN